jgi:septum site-determining protein MinD
LDGTQKGCVLRPGAYGLFKPVPRPRLGKREGTAVARFAIAQLCPFPDRPEVSKGSARHGAFSAFFAITIFFDPKKDSHFMAKIIVVTSGKGGVGKTTTSASFATGLALRGHKTAVIDFDVGLRNLDLIMGCERRVVYDLINVIQGEATLNQALIKDKQVSDLYVLAASQTRDKDALTKEGVEKVLTDLAAMDFEYIVCDSPAGIETGALMAMHFADEALIVTNPEVSSVRDSDRILGMLASKTKRAIDSAEPIKEHLLITRYNPNRVDQGQMLSLDDIKDILRIKLIGVIPESESVLQASNQGVPAVHMEGTDVAEAYKDVIDRFLGNPDKPMRFIDADKPGLLKRWFGRK